MAIRNGKEVFTTSIKPDTLEDFRQHCWANKKKMNEVIERLMIRYLRSTN